MNHSLEQLIVGSWELISTTQEDIKSEWTIFHWSKDGFQTCDVPEVKEFIYPGRYRIEGNDLVSLWESWGKENTRAKLFLQENGDLKSIDHKGFVCIFRRIHDLRPDTHAYIDKDGKLRKRKKSQRSGPDNPRPCGTSGMPPADPASRAGGMPEASGGI